MARILAEYRAAGDPAEMKDLMPPVLPPNEDGAAIIGGLKGSFTLTKAEEDLVNGLPVSFAPIPLYSRWRGPRWGVQNETMSKPRGR